jgi:ubiquinone/menaquinone biosynthesis C-methylase UbiE
VDACAVSAGQEVLDVAAGDGNFALAAAYEGASAVASDISPGMVERGRRRAAAEGYEVEWVEADAEDLPFEDARFDCVGSVFGAMFAPRPEVAAAEMFRVVRPGGTVGMIAWVPGSFPDSMFEVYNRYLPPRPEGVPPPVLWGDEDVVRERLDGLAASIELLPRSIQFEAESPEELWEFQQTVPVNVAMRENLGGETWARVREDFIAFVRDWTGVGEGPISIRSDYLMTVARKRG